MAVNIWSSQSSKDNPTTSSQTNAVLSQKKQIAISAFQAAIDSSKYSEEQIHELVGKFRAFKNHQCAVNKANELSPTICVYGDLDKMGCVRNDSVLLVINDQAYSAPVNKPMVKSGYYKNMHDPIHKDTVNHIAQSSKVIPTNEDHVLFVEDSLVSGYKTLCFFHNGVKYKLFE